MQKQIDEASTQNTMKAFHHHLLIAVAMLLGGSLAAQHSGTSFTLNQPITGGQHSYTATEFVRLAPGFRYQPLTSTDYFMAGIGEQQPVFPNIVFLDQQINYNRQLNTSLEVGTIEGDFYIDVNGNSTYSIPLTIPPAIKGMYPEATIIYKSTIERSSLGTGWLFDAVSMISRTGSSIFYDQELDGITLTAADKFSLDGERLTVISGVYGQAASEYRTANESFKKISVTEFENGQPLSFTVETKDGLKKYYGYDRNSRNELGTGGRILNWLLSRVEDNQGNYIRYYYLHNENYSYLERIEYTGNSITGLLPPNKILFKYAKFEDYEFAYIQGNRIQNNLLLTDIETTHVGEKILNYHFDYFYEDKPFLNQIRLSDKDDKSYNTTIFNYNNAIDNYNGTQHHYVRGLSELLNPYLVGGETKRMTIPLFNNGLADFVTINDNTPDYQNRQHNKMAIGLWKNSFNQQPQMIFSYLFHKPDVYNNGLLDKMLFGDFQGDGLQDVFVSIYNTNTTFELNYFLQTNNGSDFSNFKINESIFSLSTNKHDILSGDFLGIGRDQILFVENQGILGTNNTLKFTFIDLKTQEIFQTNIDAGISVTSETTGFKYLITDVNGNQKTEVMVFNNNGFNVFELTEPRINLTQLSNIFARQSPSVHDKAYICRLNVDGIDDLVFFKTNTSSWKKIISTGNGFEESGLNNLKPHHPYARSHFFVDLNGDGLTDIIDMGYPSNVTPQDYLPESIRFIYLWGDGFFEEQTIDLSLYLGQSYYNFFNVSDFDGNGALEILYYENGQSNVGTIIPTTNNSKKTTLSAVSNGLNYKTLINYEPIPQSNHVFKTSAKIGDNYFIKRNSTFITTSKYNQKAGDELKKEFYYYYNPVFNSLDNEFLGFEKTRFELQNGEEIENRFEIFPNINRLLLKEVKEYASDFYATGELIRSNNISYSFYTTYPEVVFNYPFQTEKSNHFKKTKEITTNIYNQSDLVSGNITRTYKYLFQNEVMSEIKTIDYLYTNSGSWCENKTSQIDTRFTKTGQQEIVRQTKFIYNQDINKKGLLQQTIINSNLSKPVLISINEYDGYGNPIKITKSGLDFLSSSITYTYNTIGTFPTSETNHLLQTTNFNFDSRFGTLMEVIDLKGLHTNFEYDGFGRLKSQTNPIGIIAEKDYIWNDTFLGSVYHTSTKAPGQGEVLEYFDQTQDIIGRGKQDKNGQFFYEMYQYNSYGKILKISEPTYDHAKNDIQWTEYHYDQYNRLNGIMSIGKNESFEYVDNKIITTNNLTGSVTTKTYDPSNRLISVYEDAGNLITYDYNAEGNINSTTMNNTDYNYLYDEYGHLSSYYDQSSVGPTIFEYNSIGQLIKETTPNGNVKQYYYDVLGRKESEKLNNALVATYIYDCDQNSTGELCSIQMPDNMAVFYQYDNFGRLNYEKEVYENEELHFEYLYNSNNQLTQLKYPNGLEINYIYNETGHFEGLKKDQSMNFLYKVNEYDLYGRATSFEYGNGITTLKEYDNITHSIEKIDIFPNAQPNETLFSMSFLPHPSRVLIEQRKDNLKNLTENFQYDNFARLTNINGSNGVPSTFTSYETNGNISENEGAIYDYSYSNKHHAVSSIYPKEGAPTPEQNQIITYNSITNKLESITEGEYMYSVEYDILSQRKKSQLFKNGSLIKTKRYFHNYEVVQNSNGLQKNCYIFAPAGLVCIIDEKDSVEMLNYVHTDHLGSIIGLSDELGQVIPGSVNSFDAWGRRRDPNTWQIISNFSQPLLFDRGFTGHEHLTDFNLINMNGRVYDPTIMRFLSPDPFIQAPDYSQSFNRYSYVMNNPMNLIDLSGYTWEDYEDIPPDVDDELRAILEQSGYTFDEVVVIATHLNPMEEIWKMHDGFEFDREYDVEYNSDQSMDNIYGWSVDLTFAVGSFGYSVSLGEIIDNTSNKTQQYVTYGPAFGLEISAGVNWITIVPKENFKFSDLEGTSWGVDGSYLISLSWSGNSTPNVGGPSTFDSYNMYEFGWGPGVGFSNTPESNTRFVDWIPTRLWY